MKYRASVYDDVKDFFKENYDQEITNDDVDNMSRSEVLSHWLNWNGIIGYTRTILDILDYDD